MLHLSPSDRLIQERTDGVGARRRYHCPHGDHTCPTFEHGELFFCPSCEDDFAREEENEKSEGDEC